MFFEKRNFVLKRLKKAYPFSDFLYNRMVNQILFDKCISIWKEKDNSKAISILFYMIYFKLLKKGFVSSYLFFHIILLLVFIKFLIQ